MENLILLGVYLAFLGYPLCYYLGIRSEQKLQVRYKQDKIKHLLSMGYDPQPSYRNVKG